MNRRALLQVATALGALGLLGGACGSTSAGPTGGTGGGAAAGAGGVGGTAGAPGSTGGRGAAGDAVVVIGDAAADASATDAGVASDAGAPDGPALVRLAHLSPDLPPVDLCLAPHGTTSFQGPLLGLLAHPDGGGGGGLSFAQVGAYLPVGAGTYDLRLVPANTSSCLTTSTSDAAGASLVAETTALPPFAADAHLTLLVVGELTPSGSDAPLAIRAIPDDAVLAGGAAVLRAVNAVPSLPAADFGLGSWSATWLPILTDVAFGAASATAGPLEGSVDARGYLFLAPLLPQTASVRATTGATTDVAVVHDFGIDLGSIATLFAVGGKTGDSAHPPALLLCIDNQPAGGLLSDCSTLQ